MSQAKGQPQPETPVAAGRGIETPLKGHAPTDRGNAARTPPRPSAPSVRVDISPPQFTAPRALRVVPQCSLTQRALAGTSILWMLRARNGSWLASSSPIILAMGLEDGDASSELLDRVAQVLVAESAVEMATDRGSTVEVWTIVADGPCVTASAPRLQIAEQMRLTSRVSVDGFTYRVSAVVDRAVVHSQTRAKLVLRLLDALADPVVRRSDRLDVSVRATMVAWVCDRIVPTRRSRSLSRMCQVAASKRPCLTVVFAQATGCGWSVASSRAQSTVKCA